MINRNPSLWIPTKNISQYEALDWASENQIVQLTNDDDATAPLTILTLLPILLRFADYVCGLIDERNKQ